MQDLSAIDDPLHTDLHTAINIKNAIDHIYRLPQLGYCPIKDRNFFHKYLPCSLSRDDESSANQVCNLIHAPDSHSRPLRAILDELQTVYKDMESLSLSHASGTDFYYFSLRITRAGCEYDGHISYGRTKDTLLRTWFEHSAIAGYGDMQSLETKVDPEVRDAREIPASEFEVEPHFLEKIQSLWGERFIPRNVRAVPYKIHLYGPGGHFKTHRDTPETGLVGTFLVGLGDSTSSEEGNFLIADKKFKAKPCTWVAFHPDIPHEITKLEDGYRAVLAFKIFRLADNTPDAVYDQLGPRVNKLLDQIPLPFGLLMTHRYSAGTTSLNGFDALLSAYAFSRKDVEAYMLPVVTKFIGEVFCYNNKDLENVAESQVFPFTRAHVDILLGRNVARAEKEVEWLNELEEIPFYTWDTEATLEIWKEEQTDGLNHRGNEADSTREDSIYLSYAILLLPQED
jgi:hypothetical protein